MLKVTVSIEMLDSTLNKCFIKNFSNIIID